MRYPFEGHEDYIFVETLDSGVLGATFLVRNQQDDCAYVLKTITDVPQEDFERFRLAFEALQRLNHPNLLPYKDIIFTDGHLGIIRPYVEGSTFTQYVQTPPEEVSGTNDPELEDDGLQEVSDTNDDAAPSETPSIINDDPTTPLDLTSLDLERELATISDDSRSELDEIFADITQHADVQQASFATILDTLHKTLPQIADALEMLHRYRTPHGDLHPGNIRVTQGKCQLIDYGLTPLLSVPQGSDSSDITLDALQRAMLKKYQDVAPYFAPEVIINDHHSPASDIYSLGCILFEIITQRSAHSLFNKIDYNEPLEPPSILALQPQCPSAWAEFIQAMLATSPANRPSIEALQAFLEDSPQTPTLLPPTFVAEPTTVTGRDELVERLSEDISQHPQETHLPIYLIQGEQGAGKHHLAERVSYALARSGWSILEGVFDDNEASPFSSWNTIIEQMIDLLKNCPIQLQQECMTLLRRMHTLFPFIETDKTVQNQTRLGAIEALRHVLARLSQERPLLIILSHIDKADPDSIELLHDLRAEPHTTRCVILATAHNENPMFDHPAQQHLIFRVRARLFNQEESRQFLSSIARKEDIEAFEPLLSQDKTYTPLLLKELLFDHQQESTVIQNEPLQTIFLRRIEKLKPHAREILEYIGLSSGPLRLDILQHICSTASESILTHLSTMRLIKHTQDNQSKCSAYRPGHPLVREVILKLMSRSRREPRYKVLAKAYEKIVHEPSPHISFFYWKSAGDAKRAGQKAPQTIEKAMQRTAYHHASTTTQWMIEHGDSEDEQQKMMLAQLFYLQGKHAKAIELCVTLIEESKNQDETMLYESKQLIYMINAGLFKQAAAVIDQTMNDLDLKYSRAPYWTKLASFNDWRHQRKWFKHHDIDEKKTRQDNGTNTILEQAILAASCLRTAPIWRIYTTLVERPTWPDHPVKQIMIQLSMLEHWLTLDHRLATKTAPNTLKSLKAQADKLNNQALSHYADFIQAKLYQQQGDYDQAKAFYEQALVNSTHWGPAWTWLRATILYQRGLCAIELGELEQAQAIENLLIRRERHLRLASYMASFLAANRYLAAGQYIQAQHHLDQLGVGREHTNCATLDVSQIRLQSKIDLAQGKSDVAVERLKIFIEGASREGILRFPTIKAKLLLSQGQALAALHARQHALEELRQQESLRALNQVQNKLNALQRHLPPLAQAELLRLKARTDALNTGDGPLKKRAYKRALHILDEAVTIITPISNPLAQAKCAEARGFILMALEDPDAKILLSQARHLYEHHHQHSSLHLEGWPLPENLTALKAE